MNVFFQRLAGRGGRSQKALLMALRLLGIKNPSAAIEVKLYLAVEEGDARLQVLWGIPLSDEKMFVTSPEFLSNLASFDAVSEAIWSYVARRIKEEGANIPMPLGSPNGSKTF